MDRRARWAVPVAITAVVAGGAVWGSTSASAEPTLAPISARDLLVKAEKANVQQLSGTVSSTTQLGFPALPGAASGVDWTALLSGTQTLRVFADGPQRQRVDLVGDLAQASVVRSAGTVWTWSSKTRQVTKLTLPTQAQLEAAAKQAQAAHPRTTPMAGADATPPTPQQLADRALAAVDPSTAVSVGRGAKVAGRPAYDLRLTPRTTQTTIGSVDVYVDAQTGMALRTVITPRGSSVAAIDVGFTSLDLSAPAASTFTFSAPSGSTVKDVTVPVPTGKPGAKPGATKPAPGLAQHEATTKPAVLGTGWGAVAEITLPKGVSTSATPAPQQGRHAGADLTSTLERASSRVSGSFGSGRMVSTRLVSVLLTDDGRMFVGAVTPQQLLREANGAASAH
jgi:outer membrane lipoprotein-sorting protein